MSEILDDICSQYKRSGNNKMVLKEMGRVSDSQIQLFWNNDGSAAASSSNKKNNCLHYVWGRKEHVGKRKDSFQSKWWKWDQSMTSCFALIGDVFNVSGNGIT